ncbi:MAG: ABC transporter ATP-binding protein [Nitrospiraceae bacterium]
MTDIAIQAVHLAKAYQMGTRLDASGSLAERVTQLVSSVFRNRANASSATHGQQSLWALKDVSFEIPRSHVLGIIGRNGSGKSTLLKILSRVTEPTSGRAVVRGRVGTLLEVGTGFHPELTGRDNIYLTGSILGMKRREIRKKFDEIVAFSGVEQFLDTPVKRYSSGMHVRLAFAVGAHLDPEILLVDEALAVGDLQFQKKCMQKMQDLGSMGQTIVLVSHDMQAMSRLCDRVLLLEKGRLVADGPAHQVVSSYLHGAFEDWSFREWPDLMTAPGDNTMKLCSIRIKNCDGDLTDTIDVREGFAVEMEYEVLRPCSPVTPSVTITNEQGVDLFETFDLDPQWRGSVRPVGRFVGTAWIPGNLLTEGTFFVSPSAFCQEPFHVHFFERQAAGFSVVDPLAGDSARGDFSGQMRGLVRPLVEWTNRFEPTGSRNAAGSRR